MPVPWQGSSWGRGPLARFRWPLRGLGALHPGLGLGDGFAASVTPGVTYYVTPFDARFLPSPLYGLIAAKPQSPGQPPAPPGSQNNEIARALSITIQVASAVTPTRAIPRTSRWRRSRAS